MLPHRNSTSRQRGHHLRVPNESPRDSHPLLLATAEALPSLANHSLIPVRQFAYKASSVRRERGSEKRSIEHQVKDELGGHALISRARELGMTALNDGGCGANDVCHHKTRYHLSGALVNSCAAGPERRRKHLALSSVAKNLAEATFSACECCQDLTHL